MQPVEKTCFGDKAEPTFKRLAHYLAYETFSLRFETIL